MKSILVFIIVVNSVLSQQTCRLGYQSTSIDLNTLVVETATDANKNKLIAYKLKQSFSDNGSFEIVVNGSFSSSSNDSSAIEGFSLGLWSSYIDSFFNQSKFYSIPSNPNGVTFELDLNKSNSSGKSLEIHNYINGVENTAEDKSKIDLINVSPKYIAYKVY